VLRFQSAEVNFEFDEDQAIASSRSHDRRARAHKQTPNKHPRCVLLVRLPEGSDAKHVHLLTLPRSFCNHLSEHVEPMSGNCCTVRNDDFADTFLTSTFRGRRADPELHSMGIHVHISGILRLCSVLKIHSLSRRRLCRMLCQMQSRTLDIELFVSLGYSLQPLFHFTHSTRF
jgi:hypothetical protein